MDKYITIELHKCTVALTLTQWYKLMQLSPELFEIGVKQGKMVKRSERFE